MEYKKYDMLPEIIPVEELEVLFIELIEYVQGLKNIEYSEKRKILGAFAVLADKQWHSYQTIENEMKVRIEDLLIHLWEVSSLETVELIISISATLGLVNCYQIIKDSLKKELDVSIRNAIIEAIEELDSKIHDPYWGMKNLDNKNS